ncbi:M48 family metalloprotease [Aeromonas hydrophila]|uniref:M48 family metalloprotease n=1 Tax=Aeromonas hydrophila TaxID=644 RepID=UPI001625BDEC|nr:M48 family metalloprotease [Aeromonas hydrophila]
MKLKLCVVSLILVSGFAQALEKIELEQYCNYAGSSFPEDVFGFSSDNEAAVALGKVMKYAGLEPNFEIMAANVPNAAAVIQGPKRLILYSQTFMEEIQRATNTDWAKMSILAHEIGHHLQGHTLQSGGSRPEIELQADKYSGFILQRMGASLEQAQTAMRTIGSDQGSATHPGKQARLAAIANGYVAARELNSTKPDDAPPSTTPVPQPTTPSPTSTSPQPSALTYALRAVFPQDPASYYVTSTDDIVGTTPQGQVIPVGRKIPPTVSGFVWMYATAYVTYGVDSQGLIWSRYPNGIPFQVGYITNP